MSEIRVIQDDVEIVIPHAIATGDPVAMVAYEQAAMAKARAATDASRPPAAEPKE